MSKPLNFAVIHSTPNQGGTMSARRSTSSSHRFIAIVMLALLIASLTIATASAKPSAATASLDSAGRDLLAGESGFNFTFSIENPLLTNEGPNTFVDAVSIIPPADLITSLDGAADGWETFRSATGRIIFRAIENNKLLPGETEEFTVVGTVARPAVDTVDSWRIGTSDDGGKSYTNASAPGTDASALTTKARVLKVTDVYIAGPTGAQDNSVTDGQDNVSIVAMVQNAGSSEFSSVTTSLLPTSSTSSISCPPVSATLPAQTEVPMTFSNCRFTNVGDITLRAFASTVGADAFTKDSAEITVVEKAAATYTADTLQPLDVMPGIAHGFSLSIEKTGAPQLNNLAGSLSFADGDFSAPLQQPSTVGSNEQNILLTFASTPVDGTTIADGEYLPALDLSAVDENGAAVSLEPAIDISNKITVDRNAPVVAPVLAPPASRVPGATPATSDGLKLDLSGTIQDRNVLTGNLEPCIDCSITDAFLVQYDKDGIPLANIPVTVTKTPATGNFSGTYSGSYAPSATEVVLHVTARDGAGNPPSGSTGVSSRIPVDNTAPNLVDANSGGPQGTDRRVI
ncbi:MAG: hypothetical protein ACRDI3_02795, partial [Actinomycetota bacterium]